MPSLFRRAVSGALEARGLTQEEFAYRVLPNFLLDLMKNYLRVKTEGIENIPEQGPVIVISNHSGYMGFDALMIGHQIYKERKRLPKIIAHKLWFISPDISVRVKKLNLVPATLENGFSILKKGACLILFPEGEEGNFKPTRYRYRLRRFRRGFVRLALKTGAPIVPAVVIGAEETHITLSQVRWAKHLVGIIIPIPLNVVPLPAKWKIKFLEPIYLGKHPEKADDLKYVTRLSREIRVKVQKELHRQVKKRNHIFL